MAKKDKIAEENAELNEPTEQVVEGKPGNRKVELKWNHYVLEFFIVALGISVPFMLSKWNENSNLKKAELQYYTSFKQELADDLLAIQGNMYHNQRRINNLKKGIDIVLTDTERKKVDSLGSIVVTLSDYSDFHKSSSIYEVLSNSGELDIFNNKQILLKLQQLENLYTYINRLEDTHKEVILLEFIQILDDIQLSPVKVMDANALYNFRFQNTLDLFLYISMEKDSLYHVAESDINDLILSLETEIDK